MEAPFERVVWCPEKKVGWLYGGESDRFQSILDLSLA